MVFNRSIATFKVTIIASFYLYFGWDWLISDFSRSVYLILALIRIWFIGLVAYTRTPIGTWTSSKKSLGDKRLFKSQNHVAFLGPNSSYPYSFMDRTLPHKPNSWLYFVVRQEFIGFAFLKGFVLKN